MHSNSNFPPSKLKKILIGGAVFICFLYVVSLIGGSGDSTASSSSSDLAASVVGEQVAGSFHRDCLACYGSDDLDDMVITSDVWCGWRDDKVIVHVTMTNSSAEHVTVNWHPSYKIYGGSSHGTGLTSEESSGFDSGETRDLESEQSPEGVSQGSEISSCYPSFATVTSG